MGTALLRVPAASSAAAMEPLARILESAASGVAISDAASRLSLEAGNALALLRSLVPRLKQWLEHHRQAVTRTCRAGVATASEDSAAAAAATAARVEMALAVL